MRCSLLKADRWLRLLSVLILSALAACGGGGGGSSNDATVVPPATSPSDAIASVPQSAVALPSNNAAITQCPTSSLFSLAAPPLPVVGKIAGRISFERIPFASVLGQGLDYANPLRLPARGVVVEAVAPTASGACDGSVVATTLSDGDGWYELTVNANANVCVRARAQLYRVGAAGNASSWNFVVADNTGGNRLYRLSETDAATAAARARRDLHAASGWANGDYTGTHAAAPFAVLDTVCKTLDAVLTAKSTAQFGQLVYFWSDKNTDDKNLTAAQGHISGTHFDPNSLAIYLRGDADVNADEFDEMVIAHEFGHFITYLFSRSDSIGGRHYLTDKLDPRVAFDEGWATAFAGLALGDSMYRDSLSPGSDFHFDILAGNISYPRGWYAEASIQRVLFTIGTDTRFGGLDVGLAGLLRTFAGDYKNTPALAAIFSYAYQLKNEQPFSAGGIANLLNAEAINGDAVQPFAATESNALSLGDLPVYQSIGVLGQGGAVRRICSDNVYDYREVHRNVLSLRRYLKFTAPQAANYRFTVQPQTSGGIAGFALRERGVQTLYQQASSVDATLSMTRTLAAGDYVLDVFHAGFLDAVLDSITPQETKCFNVSVQAL